MFMMQATDFYLNILFLQVDYITTLRNATKKCNKKVISLHDSCLQAGCIDRTGQVCPHDCDIGDDTGRFGALLGEGIAFQ